MRSIIALIAGLAVFLPMIAAECPNACSAHGKCGAYDMCMCYRNWMANDCSERVCQFGLAHVDTPKGDLDSSSGALSGPDVTVIQNDEVYPYGTQEQYPATTDLDGNVLTNTAHEYRECSNKGLCDRATGQCVCFEGYEGSACQRASCPTNADGMCSGHGTCQTIKEIAYGDNMNVYNLWDEFSTMGCVCDAGYTGPDCSERVCKWGADPLYYDDVQNIRYANWTYQFYATSGAGVTLTGNYSLVFYDAHGEDWQTAPLDWNATCEAVTAALEDLPNNAIPVGSVKCFKSETTTGGTSHGWQTGVDPITSSQMWIFSKYTIAFPENPGKLKQITINKYLDGTRPTLYTSDTPSTLGWHIYPNGFTGENVDMVPDYCEGVMVNLVYTGGDTTHHLAGLTTEETKLLKACLGGSDGDDTNNVDVYNWDYGDAVNPHLIKLVDATQDSSIATTDRFGDTDLDEALSKYPISRLCAKSDASPRTKQQGYPVDGFGIYICANRNPPGFYAVLFYDTTVSATYPFRLFTRSAQDYGSTTNFYVFTTTGYLQMVNYYAAAFASSYSDTAVNKVGQYYSNVIHVTNTTSKNAYVTSRTNVAPFAQTSQAGFLGDLSCETAPIGTYYALDCLQKNDHVMILNTFAETFDSGDLASNPVYPNIYRVKKISREQRTTATTPSVPESEWMRHQIHLDYSTNADFQWNGGFAATNLHDTSASVFKFHPPAEGKSYAYAGECSHRGLCNKKTGVCQCFSGFSEDNCGVVNALSN